MERLADELDKHSQLLRVGSVFSHLACADDPAMDDFTHGQIAAFERMSGALCAKLPYVPLRHLANSAGAVRFPEARFDMVRLGLGLYGFGTPGLRPVSTLRTRVVQVRDLAEGEAVHPRVEFDMHGVITFTVTRQHIGKRRQRLEIIYLWFQGARHHKFETVGIGVEHHHGDRDPPSAQSDTFVGKCHGEVIDTLVLQHRRYLVRSVAVTSRLDHRHHLYACW